MSNRTAAFRAILLASVTVLPLPALSQGTTVNQSGVADAIRVLLDQATYWIGQYQPDKADEAIRRVLVLDPRNADALALQAQMAIDRGDQPLARSAITKLQAARADDPRIATLEQALRLGPIDQTALSQARGLAQAGKPADAVAAYRRLFRGDVPPTNLAVEYYQTLANTEGGWEPARGGLATILQANPQDTKAQLAYAELLTYHDETRLEGLERLNRLALNPAVAEQANRDLRQTLLWLPVNQTSVPEYDVYLSRNPNDTEMKQRAELARNDTAGLRVGGFEALQDGKLPQAESGFNQALAKNPNDTDAMIGLALVRMRQNKPADARALLHRAIEIDPEKAAQYQPLLDSTNPQTATAQGGNGNRGNVDYGAIAARRIRGQYAEVASLTRRGEYAAAEQRLRSLMGKRPNAGNYLQLADIQARAGKLAEAEASYRTVLRSQPRNVAALGGLAGVLTREDKTDEANTIFAEVARAGGGTATGQSRAASLRTQAGQVSDPVAKIGLYRSAVAADPANPWIRLELARVLLAQNQGGEARQVMTEVTSNPRATVDQLKAGVYFADGAHDYGLALSLVGRLPAAARTPEMRDVATRSELALDLRNAGSGRAAVPQLLVLAQKPDPTGTRVATIAAQLVKDGDKPDAREAVRAALGARPPMPQQRIAYAAALVEAGYPEDAQALTAGLQPTRLNPLERSRLTEVRDNAAVFAADNLNNKGQTAEAYDQLAPRLAQDPQNPDLNMALARLYEAKKQPTQALRINEELLRRNPSSPTVRSATIGAAIAAGDLAKARNLADEAKEQFPDDPQVWMMSAQVARARGDSGRALSDLRTARSLRRQQLDSSSSDRSSLRGLFERSKAFAAVAFGSRYALNVPANTASDVGALPLPTWEPVTREYAQYVPPGQGGAFVPTSRGDAPLPFGARPTTGDLSVPPGTDDAGLRNTQSAQTLPPLAPSYVNPFRPAPSPTLDEPSAVPSVLGGQSAGPAFRREPADPLTQDIDRSIQQVSNDVAPRLEGSVSLRGRSGSKGLSTLFDVEAPVEASFSPNGYGRLKVQVTPVYLYAGKAGASDLTQFGTNPLVANGRTFPGARNQSAGGSAIDVGYAYDFVSADVGATPLGFQQQNVVGGIEFHPRLTNNLTLRVLGDRRAVTDSLLSYAGTKDTLSGQKWGGVTRNRGHIQLEGQVGGANFYLGAGGGVLVGSNVKSNTEIDAGAGVSFPVWSSPTMEVRTGADLVYFGFDRNLGNFTIGNGGYFSPQSFFAALFPVNFRHQATPDLVYNVGASIGYQIFNAKSEEVFPNDRARQAQLEALAGTSVSGVTSRFNGYRGSGVAGGAHADIDYRVTDNFHVGARAGFDKSGNFTEGTGLVYGRYVFNDPL